MSHSWTRWLWLWVTLSCALGLLAACGGPGPAEPTSPQAEPTIVPAAAATQVLPTAALPTQPPAATVGQEQPIADVADSGFRPEVNGFQFKNYSDKTGITNLTPAELVRMFGEEVCASQAGSRCTLTPPARQWMEQINNYMANGHCEGMAVLSSLMYYGRVDPRAFGGEVAHDLELSNTDLQREIAYWWATQNTVPGASIVVNESPTAVLDTLIEAFKPGRAAGEWWAVGLYKPDGTSGHSVTPIAVEDKGNGLYDILVYDNNFPDTIRAIEVNRQDNTWQYQASTNPEEEPELYTGDAGTQTLEVVAISPRLEEQGCLFCRMRGEGRLRGQAQPSDEIYEIWLEGQADLLISDEEGRRIGFADGKFLNEIPGATGENLKYLSIWDLDNEPVYRLPADKMYDVIIDGSRLAQGGESVVSLIGPGFFLDVDGIWLEPSEQDHVVFGMEETFFALNYWTEYTESPTVTLGLETEAADYAFMVRATEMTALEDAFYIGVQQDDQVFFIDTSDNTEPVTFDLWMLRIDDEGEHIFGGSDLILEPNTVAYLLYTEWDEDGSIMVLDIDSNGDGEPEATIEMPDIADEFYWEEE